MFISLEATFNAHVVDECVHNNLKQNLNSLLIITVCLRHREFDGLRAEGPK